MNFLDLYKKIKQLEESVEQRKLNEGLSQGTTSVQAISAAPSAPISECGMGECGDMPTMGHGQQDSVSMNVSMNASGAGGIRNLMNILKNIDDIADKGSEPHIEPKGSDSIMIGEPEVLDSIEPVTFEEPALPQVDMPVEEPMMSDEPVMDEVGDSRTDYANDPTIRKMSVAAVIGKGNDLASKGKEAPKQAGGGNPWNVNETRISAKLLKHYEEVKNRSVTEAHNDRDMPGYGDPETWGGRYPDGDGPSRGKKKGFNEPDDRERIPGTGSQSDIEGDILDKWQKGFKAHQSKVKVDYVDKEGVAPNGKPFNKLYVIQAKDAAAAQHQVYLFDKYEWGAKNISDQKTRKNDDGSVLTILYIVDNHKYGHFNPWKSEPPTKI